MMGVHFLRNIGFTVDHSFIVTFLLPGLRLLVFGRNKIILITCFSLLRSFQTLNIYMYFLSHFNFYNIGINLAGLD